MRLHRTTFSASSSFSSSFGHRYVTRKSPALCTAFHSGQPPSSKRPNPQRRLSFHFVLFCLPLVLLLTRIPTRLPSFCASSSTATSDLREPSSPAGGEEEGEGGVEEGCGEGFCRCVSESKKAMRERGRGEEGERRMDQRRDEKRACEGKERRERGRRGEKYR